MIDRAKRNGVNRRRLIGAGLGGAATVSLSSPAIAQGKGIRFKMVTDRVEEAERLARRLASVSGGRLQIRVQRLASKERGTVLDRVGSAETDLYLTNHDALVSQDQRFGLFAAMPMGMTAAEMDGWRVADDGQKQLDRLGDSHGIKPFVAGDNGAQALWSAAPLNDLRDLRKGPIASVGLGLSTLREMGLEAVELEDDLSARGDLIALEGFSARHMVETGLIRDFPHMIPLNANRPMSQSGIGMNILLWFALSDADRLLLERVFAAHHAEISVEALHKAVTAQAALSDTIDVGSLPADIWAAQGKASLNVLRGIAQADPVLVDSYQFFLGDVARWSEIGEASFVSGRRDVLEMQP